MSIMPAYKYQLSDHKSSIIIYYCIILAVFGLLFLTTTSLLNLGTSISIQGTISGLDLATVTFLFISGLCSFKEPFFMLTQNGVSRKAIFCSRMEVFITIALIMSIIDNLLILAGKTFASSVPGHFQCFSMFEIFFSQHAAAQGTFVLFCEAFLFNTLLYLATLTVGYFLTIMFFRLNKMGKILVGAGVPILLLIILPVADTYFFSNNISAVCSLVVNYLVAVSSGKPFIPMLLLTVFFIILSAFSWLMIRKATVRE